VTAGEDDVSRFCSTGTSALSPQPQACRSVDCAVHRSIMSQYRVCACTTTKHNTVILYKSFPEPVAQSVRGSDCGSEGMGLHPHLGKSKVRLFSLSILTDKIFWWFRVVRSLLPPFPKVVLSVCRITNGECGR
jgi:hypothetical protein